MKVVIAILTSSLAIASYMVTGNFIVEFIVMLIGSLAVIGID